MGSNPTEGMTKLGGAEVEEASGQSSTALTATQRLLREYPAFRIQAQIEENLRREMPYSKFEQEITLRFKSGIPKLELPAARILRLLYERGLDALITRRHAQELKELRRTEQWKKHKEWIQGVTEQIEELEKTLGLADWNLLPSSLENKLKLLRRQLDRFSDALCEVETFDQRLDDISRLNLHSATLQDTRRMMDRLLKRELPHLATDPRLELVAMAIEAIGLNPRESVEAISKSLYRGRNRHRGGRR